MPEKLDATNINQLRKIILKAPEKLKELHEDYKKKLKAYREVQAEYDKMYSRIYLICKAKESLSIQDASHKATQDDEVWVKRMMMIKAETEYRGVRNEMKRIDDYFTGCKKVLESLTQEQKYLGA